MKTAATVFANDEQNSIVVLLVHHLLCPLLYIFPGKPGWSPPPSLPLLLLLRDIDTSTEVVHKAVIRNKNYWVAMKNILEERGVREKMDVMEIFQVG